MSYSSGENLLIIATADDAWLLVETLPRESYYGISKQHLALQTNKSQNSLFSCGIFWINLRFRGFFERTDIYRRGTVRRAVEKIF